MPTPGSGTIGALDYSTEERQKLAKKYLYHNMRPNVMFQSPKFLQSILLHSRSLNWQCDTCGKVVDLLSKNSVKKPITEEEQTMLKTIALKVSKDSYFKHLVIYISRDISEVSDLLFISEL